MIELIPNLTTRCVELAVGPGELCVRFPGGVSLCASMQTTELGDPGEISKDLLGQVGAAMTPLQPFFNIIEAFKAVFDCLSAVPDAITHLDVGGLLQCVPNLQKAVSKLLSLQPPVPVLQLVKDTLGVIVVALQGIRAKMGALIKQADRIAAAATRASELGLVQLQVAVDCANANLDAQLSNVNAATGPLNRLISTLNLLLKLTGQDCIGAVGGFDSVSEAALAPLDATIEFLQVVQSVVPTPDIELPGLPPAGDCP